MKNFGKAISVALTTIATAGIIYGTHLLTREMSFQRSDNVTRTVNARTQRLPQMEAMEQNNSSVWLAVRSQSDISFAMGIATGIISSWLLFRTIQIATSIFTEKKDKPVALSDSETLNILDDVSKARLIIADAELKITQLEKQLPQKLES